MIADTLRPVLLRQLRAPSGLAPLLFVAAAYYIAAETAFAVGTLAQSFAPFWPPNAVLLCTLLVVSPDRWWMYLVAALPAHVAAELGAGMPPMQSVVAFACNISFAVLSAIALRRLIRGPPWLGDLRKAAIYVLTTSVVSPGLVAFVAGTEPTFADGTMSQYWVYWWRWYLSNAVASLTLTPVFLTWFVDGRPAKDDLRGRWFDAVALTLGLIVTSAVAVGMTSHSTAERFIPALLYAPVPLLLAAAARFGGRGASGGIFIVTVVALWFVMQGQGPFFTTRAGYSVFALQFFLVSVSVPVILIAALVEQLHRTNSSLTAVLAGISDCYYMLDREWRFAIVAPKAAAWLGRAPDSIIGAKASDMRTEGEPLVRQAAGNGVPIHAEVPSAVHPGRWIDLHAYPWSEGISVFFRDVSGRKQAERALRDSEESFRVMAQTVPDILFASYPEGGCAYLSGRFHEYTGLSPGATLGFGWTDALHPDDRERVLTARQNAGQTGEPLALECRLRAADGTYRWFVARWRPILNAEGRTAKWFGAITDIDDLKQVEAALRTLTGKLLAAQDEERRRIARELHDSTAQDLLGIAFGIHKVLRMSANMPAGATAALRETQRLIDKCQKEIRAISYLMHPPMLGEGGLVSALRWFIEGFMERTGILVDLDIGPDPGRLPPDVETALFRVAQEALANVHRHSGSASASIRLHRRRTPGAEDCVVLAITDEGRGLPPDVAGAFASGTRRAAARVGVGLLGMDERLRQIGGRLRIRSRGTGATIRAVVPLGTRVIE